MLSRQNLHRTYLFLIVAFLASTVSSCNVDKTTKFSSQNEIDQFWADVNLNADYVTRNPVVYINMSDDKSISPDILSNLKNQGKNQFDLFLSSGQMLENEVYSPTLQEFVQEYPAFFNYKILLGKFNAFERFQQMNNWQLPEDLESFHNQVAQTTARLPFLQIPTRFLTYFGYKVNRQNITVEDVVITRSKVNEMLYDITMIIKGKKERYHAVRNESCYYKEGRGCLTYLSWDYLGRITDMSTGQLYTNQDLWRSEHFDKN